MISPFHNFFICNDLKELSLKGARLFTDCAVRSIKEKGSFNVALSGGSTPKALYYLLSKDEFKESIDWNRIQFYFGDERAVPPDHRDSNYRMAFEMLLKKVPVPETNIHRIKGELGKEGAASYRNTLVQTIKEKKNGIPLLDLIILGMGDDGHTASLFPETDSIKENEMIVASLYVEKLDSMRITMTAPLIQAAANVLILVSGKEKASILKKIKEEKNEALHCPIELVNNCTGHVTWLVDKDAAMSLQD